MKKYLLSLATNYKDEDPYLKEWLDYHLAVGVDHFYLFNQDGSESSWEIVKPYIERGVATVHDWTNFEGNYEGHTYFFQKNRNHMGYIHAAQNYYDETEWLLKIDVDEFLFMADESTTVKEWLKKVNKKDTRAVRVPRIDFGSSGYETKPDGGVLENFLLREIEPSNYKDMANTDFLDDNKRCFSSHRWSYRWFTPRKMITPEFSNGLRINHYYTKSKEEYFNRQNICHGRKVSADDFKLIEDRTNAVKDDSMLGLLPLKK